MSLFWTLVAILAAGAAGVVIGIVAVALVIHAGLRRR